MNAEFGTMNSRPILFSTAMVRAILSGKKTQTRRVIDPQPEKKLEHLADVWFTHYWMSGGMWNDAGKIAKCPYGEKGDALWVRETWLKDGEIFLYKADFGKGVISDSWNGHWKPSIFMPRDACRIMLKINNIRVERVQEISRDDAKAEGVSPVWAWDATRDPKYFERGVLNPYVANYSVLWDEINEKRGFGWNANPWVWVMDFERMEVNNG